MLASLVLATWIVSVSSIPSPTTVTIYGFHDTTTTILAGFPTPVVSYLPIGVGADGATTYLEEILVSVSGFIQVDATTTITSLTTIPVQTYYGSFFQSHFCY